MNRTLTLAGFLACIAFGAKAHEFWIDPEEFQVPAGGAVTADLRVGQDFEGGAMSYLPPKFRRFDYIFDRRIGPVPGVIGDRPALRMSAPGDGLLIVVHQTTNSTITWDTWEEFVAFVEHKDAMWTLEAHDARGLERESVREVYSRYAKSLIAAGEGAGSDLETGLLTEIVAEENPYTDNMDDGIDVRVLYQGEPRIDEQIEIYEKAADGSVNVFTLRTDDAGRATVPVKPGHRYMLDSVVLREPDVADFAWESLWANLTFAVPE